MRARVGSAPSRRPTPPAAARTRLEQDHPAPGRRAQAGGAPPACGTPRSGSPRPSWAGGTTAGRSRRWSAPRPRPARPPVPGRSARTARPGAEATAPPTAAARSLPWQPIRPRRTTRRDAWPLPTGAGPDPARGRRSAPPPPPGRPSPRSHDTTSPYTPVLPVDHHLFVTPQFRRPPAGTARVGPTVPPDQRRAAPAPGCSQRRPTRLRPWPDRRTHGCTTDPGPRQQPAQQ
ncbi:hypothetical protein JJ691_88950 [Kutzneria sp. CA-103260]|nr:hypothetical protein JJ691_88950 [Kutzneria sp. CA-103260]